MPRATSPPLRPLEASEDCNAASMSASATTPPHPLGASEECNAASIPTSASTLLRTIHRPRIFPTLNFHLRRQSPCDGQCNCVCHSRRRLQTPDILSSLIGALYIGYVNIIHSFNSRLNLCHRYYH